MVRHSLLRKVIRVFGKNGHADIRCRSDDHLSARDNPVTDDENLTRLQETYPAWEVWIVRTTHEGIIWCARRQDNHKALMNADSPEHLAEYINEHEEHYGEAKA
jgi:hypothetical protein